MSKFSQEDEQEQEPLEEVLALSDGASLFGVTVSHLTSSHSLQITLRKKGLRCKPYNLVV